MTHQEIINKWLPIFKYETMLSKEIIKLLNDIEENNLDIDEIIKDINILTY